MARVTRQKLHLYTVSQKTTWLWNGMARNYEDRFWWYLAEIFKKDTRI